MRIIEEEQLDFDDVLIQPKCSKILSRKDVNLFRTFKWENNSNEKFEVICIPYGTTNMGTCGTIKMARIMIKSGHIACLEKHIPYEEIEEFFSSLSYEESVRVIPSIGIKESVDDIIKLYKRFKIKMIMIDVPNGYIPSLVDRIKFIHKECPDSMIIAGNVVDSAGASQLIDAGASIIKVGIGSGCFLGDMEIITSCGLKKIKNIEIGDSVLTHDGSFKPVINKFMYNTHKSIISINDIDCTPNHEFYVANINDLDKITDTNYKKYCFWVEAKDLDPQIHRLVEITP